MLRWRLFVLLGAGAWLCAFSALGQDTQSIADLARQARLQKQHKEGQTQNSANATGAAPAKTAHVITNDEIPERVGSTLTPAYAESEEPGYTTGNSGARKGQADPSQPDPWKTQILAQKSAIASLEEQIKSASDSIHFPAACLRNCAQRNEREIQKQDQVENMKQQLEEQKQRLAEMQESARKLGYGSAIYDP
ncbi:MAG TPA: hypothetical protein VGM18_14600 [Candidatus Sulfotelmatobacter sp.]|jgi:predicted RNase H-like nuclease (RuvC/YqgF family)